MDASTSESCAVRTALASASGSVTAALGAAARLTSVEASVARLHDRFRLGLFRCRRFFAGVFAAGAFFAVVFAAGGLLRGASFSRRSWPRGLCRGGLSRGLRGGLGRCGLLSCRFLRSAVERTRAARRPASPPERVQVQLAHLGDVLRQVVERPVVDRDRREHRDIDRARIQRGGVPRGDDLRIADHDGNDGDSRRHRDAERTLLERPDFGGVQPGALGGDHDRKAVSGAVFDGVQRLDRGGRVVAVDEHTVQQLAHRAHDRVALQLLLAHPNPVVLHQRTGR